MNAMVLTLGLLFYLTFIYRSVFLYFLSQMIMTVVLNQNSHPHCSTQCVTLINLMEGNQTWVKDKVGSCSVAVIMGSFLRTDCQSLMWQGWCSWLLLTESLFLLLCFWICVMDSGAEWKFITIYKEKVLRMENGRNLIVLIIDWENVRFFKKSFVMTKFHI